MRRSIAFAVVILATQICLGQVLRWDFDTGMEEWLGNGDVKELRAEGGSLQGYTRGIDPSLQQLGLNFKPSLLSGVRFRIKTDNPGGGQVFFTETNEGRYEGYSEEKSIRFRMSGGNQWEVITVKPNWCFFPQIIKLRLDLANQQKFEIDWIEVFEEDQGVLSTETSWTFKDNKHPAWSTDDDGAHLSPVLKIDPGKTPFVVATVRCHRRARAQYHWKSEMSTGALRERCIMPGDGKWHKYTFLATAILEEWKGELSQISLRIVSEDDTPYELASIEMLPECPSGPDVLLCSFGAQDYPVRVGKPNSVLLHFRNNADDTLSCDVKVRVKSGEGVELVRDGKPYSGESVLAGGYDTRSVFFDVVSKQAQTVVLTADFIQGEKVFYSVDSLPIVMTPVPTLHAGATYVPEPKPAKTDYLIGSYYFPGYGKGCSYHGSVLQEWPMLVNSNPWTKPALGYYDESRPEVVDWQIKWALEHGVNFFLVDWYWDAGENYLEHWIDAFQQAKYRSGFKWAVMWANHNRPGSHTKEDWIAVVNRWIGKYFNTDEYLQMDGKPVVFIWDTANLRRDLGGSEAAAEMLALADKMVREAGLKGVTFWAMNATNVDTLKSEGYVGHTSYHWWSDAALTSRDQSFFSFDAIADRAAKTWTAREKLCLDAGMKYLPVVDTGWDGRPRHALNTIIIYNRTGETFKKKLVEAKKWLDQRGQNMLLLAPWNEWTEGSYIEPCSDFGFDMLRAIRDVFCQETGPSDDTCPPDLGLGPYGERPPMNSLKPYSTQMSWIFAGAEDKQGWRPASWGPGKDDAPNVTKDGLTFVTVGNDPIIYSPTLSLPCAKYDRVEIAMSVSPVIKPGETHLEVFWATSFFPINAKASMHCLIEGDSEMHTYVLPLSEHPHWAGRVTRFRIDPVALPGKRVTIKSIRFLTPGE
jgi:hypothetical protein